MRKMRKGLSGGLVRGLEKMEARRMFSGNVTAANVGGVIVITGDTKCNGIVVDSNPDFTTSITPALGTTVNGKTTPTVISGGLPISINMGDGDDSVQITDMLQQSVDCFTGAGNDVVLVSKSSTAGSTGNVFGHLTINTDSGNDLVSLANSTGVASDLSIDTGSGIDVVSVSGTVGVGNNMSINTANGLSVTSLFGTYSIGGNLTINGGSGLDVLIKSQAAFTVGGTTTIKNIDLIL